MKHTEGTSPDRSADQLEVLREQREKLAGRADRRDPSPDIAREKPVEALQSALESLRVAEKELRQQNEDLLAAQRALEDERRRYQGLFELAPCGYVVTDAFGIIQEMNRTAELLFNHRRESLRRKPLVVLFPREARPSFLSHLHRLLRRGAREVETWETPLVRAGAAPFPAEVAASAVLDGEGRPAGLCWLVRDVSDRKEVERALEAERELVAVILRGTADGLVATDRTGSVVLVNEVARTILGDGGDEILGRRLQDTLACAGRSVRLSPITGAEGVAYEVTLEAPRPRVFDLRVSSIESDGHLLLLREVTAECAARERAEQQARLAATGQLAAGIAHDFNNVLSVVLAHADLLRKDHTLRDDVRVKLRGIADQARRGGRLVRQVLDFARRAPTRRQRVDLAACVRETMDLLERTIPENVVVSTALPTECLAEVDPVQVEQVVANLVLNAGDAMPGGGRLRIELSRRTLKEGEPPPVAGMTPGEWAALSVADTGFGMSPAVQRRLFEPFFSTKAGRGTGLGLAQVHGIVKQHGGSIDVTSEVGRGTTFTVYLPLAGARVGTRRAPKATDLDDDAGSTLPTGWGELILLVEDDAAARVASADALRSLGYRVLVAECAEQAWELWVRHGDEIALVLTDLVLPGVGGAHLCSALARQGRAPVIALSGYPIDAEDSRLAGVAHRLQKPVGIERLAQVIHRTLAAARR